MHPVNMAPDEKQNYQENEYSNKKGRVVTRGSQRCSSPVRRVRPLSNRTARSIKQLVKSARRAEELQSLQKENICIRLDGSTMRSGRRLRCDVIISDKLHPTVPVKSGPVMTTSLMSSQVVYDS